MLLTEHELTTSYGPPQTPKSPELDISTLSDNLGAAFRQENTIGSMFSNLPFSEPFTGTPSDIDPEYNVFTHVKERGLEPYLDKFDDVFNNDQFEARAQKIEKQLADRELLSQSGAKGIASTIIAGSFDIVNLIPVGGALVKGVKANSVLQASINTAKVAAPSIVAQEALLNSTQETRTLGESVVNIAAGTVLAAGLGAGVAGISKAVTGKDFSTLLSNFEKDIIKPIDNISDADIAANRALYSGNVDDSIGAARALQTTLDQESLAPSLGVASATKGLTPSLRLAQSQVKEVRVFSQKLVNQSSFLNKNFESIPTIQSVENLRFEQDIRDASIATGFRDSYKSHKKASQDGRTSSLNRKEFNESLSYAMRNDDIGATDEITDLARKMRREVIQPLTDKAIDLGMLPEDVSPSTAMSYFTRMHSKEKMITNPKVWREIVVKDFKSKIKSIENAENVKFLKKISTAKKAIKNAKPSKLKDVEQDLIDIEFEHRMALEKFTDDDYIDSAVDELFNKLIGLDRQPLTHELVIAEHGPLKDRTWDIQDNTIADFLENDAEYVLGVFNRKMTGQLLLKEQFGTIDFNEAKKLAVDEFNNVIKSSDAKAAKKLANNFKSNLNDMKMLWDLTNGTYRSAHDYDNAFIKGLQNVRSINYMRLLGDVTRSSFTDVANVTLVHGYGRAFGDLLLPMMKNLKQIKPAVGELRDAGLVYESILNNRIQSLMEVGDPFARGTAFSRVLSNSTTVFSKATGITYWNDFMKSGAGILTQSRIIKNAHSLSKGEKLKKGESAVMNFLGLSDSDLRAISLLQKQHGSMQKGIILSGASKWENNGIARKYRAALNKDVNSTIVTKGISDVPSFANSELGKSVIQFQNFSFAAHQRITIRTAQRMAKGDVHLLTGVTSLISMGMYIAYLKAEGYKKGMTDSWTADKWLLEGIDRSGIIPVLMMVNNPWEKVGLPGLGKGLSKITGNESSPVSRYASRGVAESLSGPTFGTAVETGIAISSVMSGNMTDRDVHRLRKLAPFQNLIGLRMIIDEFDPVTKGQ